MRIRLGWGLRGGIALLLLAMPPALAQETDAAPPGAAGDEAFAPAPQLDRSQWLVLMVLLGEQLPPDVILTGLAFNVAPADVRVHVVLPRARAFELEEEMALNLGTHFPKVSIVAPPSASEDGVYVERHITLTGIPTFEAYRAAKRAAAPQGTESGTDVTAPTGAPAPGPQPAPARNTPDAWPTTQLRRLFTETSDKSVRAQFVMGGREYIVREGKTFANHQYRFAGVAQPAVGSTESPCITIEHVATGETRTVCTSP